MKVKLAISTVVILFMLFIGDRRVTTSSTSRRSSSRHPSAKTLRTSLVRLAKENGNDLGFLA